MTRFGVGIAYDQCKIGTCPDNIAVREWAVTNSLPDLDLGSFMDKDTAPKKDQKTLASAFTQKTLHNMEEKFWSDPVRKQCSNALKGHTLKIS